MKIRTLALNVIMDYTRNKIELEENGYSILANVYSESEINQILGCLKHAEQNESSFLKTKDLFAIRQLVENVPELSKLLFNKKLTELISNLFQSNCFLTKAIYFDKPSESNWFVAYHQDLSISVDKKANLENYVNWTFKKGQYGVQPPIKILQDTITIRIHLDDTNKDNGALKVIPKSHLKGIIRTDSEEWNIDNEIINAKYIVSPYFFGGVSGGNVARIRLDSSLVAVLPGITNTAVGSIRQRIVSE